MSAKIKTHSSQHYGWLPDLPDFRDLLYSKIAPRIAALPPSVSLQAGCPAFEFLEKKDGAPFADLSRLFVCYNERVIEDTVTQDSGAFLRDGVKSLAKQGVCREGKRPYAVGAFTRKPPQACYSEATNHQTTSYHRLNTVHEMRVCLADGYPFVFGFTVYDGF